VDPDELPFGGNCLKMNAAAAKLMESGNLSEAMNVLNQAIGLASSSGTVCFALTPASCV